MATINTNEDLPKILSPKEESLLKYKEEGLRVLPKFPKEGMKKKVKLKTLMNQRLQKAS